jgi:putative membrane protein
MDYTFMWPQMWQFGGWWIFPLLCFAFMVLMLWLMFRHGGCMPSARRDRDASAREILDRRYAGGELDKPQYEAMRRELAG